VLTLGWHVSHVLLPFVAPAATHAPLIAQNPAFNVGAEHVPVEVEHVPAVWQASGAAHVTWLPAAHVPAWQVSLRSHALPSLQVVPFAAAGFEHWPFEGSHAPTEWHWSDAVHTTGFAPVHAPL